MTNDSLGLDILRGFYQPIIDGVPRIPDLAVRYAGEKAVLAQWLQLHRRLTAAMKEADAAIEAELLKCPITFGGEQIDGVGTVIVHTAGKKTRYDNDALISKVAAHLSDRVQQADPETGEIPPPSVATQMAVETMADLVGARAPSFSSWRKGPAKANGIELEKYSETEGGRLSVRIEG